MKKLTWLLALAFSLTLAGCNKPIDLNITQIADSRGDYLSKTEVFLLDGTTNDVIQSKTLSNIENYNTQTLQLPNNFNTKTQGNRALSFASLESNEGYKICIGVYKNSSTGKFQCDFYYTGNQYLSADSTQAKVLTESKNIQLITPEQHNLKVKFVDANKQAVEVPHKNIKFEQSLFYVPGEQEDKNKTYTEVTTQKILIDMPFDISVNGFYADSATATNLFAANVPTNKEGLKQIKEIEIIIPDNFKWDKQVSIGVDDGNPVATQDFDISVGKIYDAENIEIKDIASINLIDFATGQLDTANFQGSITVEPKKYLVCAVFSQGGDACEYYYDGTATLTKNTTQAKVIKNQIAMGNLKLAATDTFKINLTTTKKLLPITGFMTTDFMQGMIGSYNKLESAGNTEFRFVRPVKNTEKYFIFGEIKIGFAVNVDIYSLKNNAPIKIDSLTLTLAEAMAAAGGDFAQIQPKVTQFYTEKIIPQLPTKAERIDLATTNYININF